MVLRRLLAITACAALASCGKSGNPATSGAPPPQPKGDMTAAQVANLQRGDLSCPPRTRMPARAAGAPVDDIVGVRPGMSYEEAAAYVMCSAPLMVVTPDNDHGFDIKTSGYTLRQGFVGQFAKAHHEMSGREFVQQMEDDSDALSTNRRVERTPAGESRWYVGTVGLPGQEVVSNAAREEHFAAGQQPGGVTLVDALQKKYGKPSRLTGGSGNEPAVIRWIYSPEGQLAVPGSQLANGCAGPSGPDDGFQITGSCGIVVTAQLTPSAANPQLVERLAVGVVDSAGTLKLIQATEKTLADRRSREQDAQARKADKDVAAPSL